MEHVHITIIPLLLKRGEPKDPEIPLEGTACKTGDFIFTNGLFFAKFGTQLHQRIMAADLYDLLISPTALSVATDSGMVRHPMAPKPGAGEYGDDGVGFYCAQLLHYGLQPQQDMKLAKKALLAAFGGRDGKCLEVPKSILEYAEGLSDSWWASNDGSEKSSSIDSTGNLDTQSQNSEGDACNSSGVHSPSEDMTRQTILKRARSPSVCEESPEMRRPAPPGFKTAEEAMMATASDETIGPKEWVKMYRKQEVDRMMGGPGICVEPLQWEGLYNIEAPSLETSGNTLKVYSSSTSSHLWATFDFGVFSGIMRSLDSAPASYDTEVYFEWRGRESGENVMYFHQENRAVITFLPGGLLEGKMCAPRHGTFKIYGSIQVNNARGSVFPRKSKAKIRKDVRLWKGEWRGLNEHNYNRECESRWGKGGGNSRDEEAFESDTTDGNEKRSWETDLRRFMRIPEEEDDLDEGNSGDGDSEESDSDGENSEDEDSEEDESEEEDDVDEY